MICDLPSTNIWQNHLYDRIDEAINIGLIRESDTINLSDSIMFIPDVASVDSLSELESNDPISYLTKKPIHKG